MQDPSVCPIAHEIAQRCRVVESLIEADIASGCARSDGDLDFSQRALELFEFQFRNNQVYRSYCEQLGISIESVQEWKSIPALPIAAFKEYSVSVLAETDRRIVFRSSGTTGQIRSCHYHCAETLRLYHRSAMGWFEHHLGHEAVSSKAFLLSLTPPPEEASTSSLVSMLSEAILRFGSAGSCFIGQVGRDGVWEVDGKRTLQILTEMAEGGRPVLLMGTAFNILELLDFMASTDQKISLAAGSRVMETGGYKGRVRSVPRSELCQLLERFLGLSVDRVITEYGMSELSSQAYGSSVERTRPPQLQFPPWVRVRVISPENGREVSIGEIGVLHVYDLANVGSVMAIATSDLVRRFENPCWIEWVGRVSQSEPRGCSLQSPESFAIQERIDEDSANRSERRAMGVQSIG